MAASSGSSSGRRRGGRPPTSGNQRGGASGPGGGSGGSGGSGSSRSSRPAGSGSGSGSGGSRSGGGGRHRGGGRGGGGRGGGSGRGGGQQSGGGRGRPGGGASNRPGSGGQRGSSDRGPTLVAAEPIVSIEPVATPNEDEALARRNRRRGMGIAGFPGVIAGVVVALVCIGLIDLIAGVVAGVAVGIVVGAATWWGATPALVRALHAEPADEDEYARVFNQVEGLCATMGLVLPTVCVVEDDARAAVAFGRHRRLAVLVVTSGLVDALDPVQLEGVLAHELVHVKCADIVPATMAAAVALPLAAVLPGTANLVHALAGRGREFRTDQRAVSITRYPPGLRDALAVLIDGPASRPPSPLAGRGVAHVTRWLWTVSLPDSSGGRRSGGGVAGELDDAGVRISALDEW